MAAKRLIRPTFSGATRGYGALYCRMAAKRLIRPTFSGATRGIGAALLPDGGETPYPAYVYERNPWLRCRFIAGWRRCLIRRTGRFCRPDKRKRHQAQPLLGGQQIGNGAHT